MEQYKEPIIFPVSLALDHTYVLHLRSKVKQQPFKARSLIKSPTIYYKWRKFMVSLMIIKHYYFCFESIESYKPVFPPRSSAVVSSVNSPRESNMYQSLFRPDLPFQIFISHFFL